MENNLANKVSDLVRKDESMAALLHSFPKAILLFDKQESILFANHMAKKLFISKAAVGCGQPIDAFLGTTQTVRICDGIRQGTTYCFLPLAESQSGYFASLAPIDIAQEYVGSVMIIDQSSTPNCFQELFAYYSQISKALKSLLHVVDEQYFIADAQGNVLTASPGVEALYGFEVGEGIGHNISVLQARGAFYPSVTAKVLSERQKVSLLQKTGAGRILLVSGTPVISHAGEIIRVVGVVRDVSRLYMVERELIEVKQELEQLKRMQMSVSSVVYKSPQMEKVMALAERAAKVDSNVLILGESGVGKGILAETIHKLSSRSDKQFVCVNCGAIPETLIEAELFGYARGAFTGANKDGKIGLVEEAHGGTLFLDEVSELPFNMQVKVLKVLGEKRFMRVGSSKVIESDFRIITATNGDLATLVQEGRFREDLYYRLNVIPIFIPPLRKRKDDTLLLINYFLHKYNQKYGWKKKISPASIDFLTAYNWPGNVRELENGIERLLVTIDTDIIGVEDLPTCLIAFSQKFLKRDSVAIVPLQKALEQTERQIILKAYQQCKNTYKLAEKLQISQSTVVRKLKKYGIGQEELSIDSVVN